jgi:hypothetical protein
MWMLHANQGSYAAELKGRILFRSEEEGLGASKKQASNRPCTRESSTPYMFLAPCRQEYANKISNSMQCVTSPNIVCCMRMLLYRVVE